MRGITDLRLLWVVGAIMIVFCSVGLLAAAMVFALPFYVGAVILGASEDATVKWFFYSALLWAPIGFGTGAAASAALSRGCAARATPKSSEAG